MGQRRGGITALLQDYAQAETRAPERAVMRLSVLDWAVCGMAGRAEGGFDTWANTLTGQGPCTRFDGRTSDAADAALVNGTLSHALDYDDTHFAHIGHPSVVVVSAALAIAEARGVSMSAMIDAALVGAEASVAVGLWLGRGHYQVGYHQTATAGTFGATIAAGRLMALGDERMRRALGLASTMASGLKSQFGTMGKPLNAGLAARAGVEAAQWAAAGMTSAADGLDGPLGFGETHHGAGDDVPFAWRMCDVSHKFHACCHGLHATLEALAQVEGLRVADMVRIETHPRWLSVCNKPDPTTGLEAKFSYAHVAAMAAHGIRTANIAQFTDACARDPDLVAWRKRVAVVGDPTLSEMQARVTVGDAIITTDLAATDPATRADRCQQKARALVGARADDLWQAIEGDDLTRFAQLLTS
ncbi:MmgE/PrpD family protein [uncultured Tateyamaria sp.]|uniref:MmgE/PrpD family protein n=1 Tax=Tateyamaria sp. 1078 TaxID=3417464 RepID=UPI0026097708|nr:MmgE/PrpD family protein [uncultured Tateyamaria sp.]